MSLAHAIKKQQPSSRIVYIGLRGEVLADYLQDRFNVFDEVAYVRSGKYRRYHNQSTLSAILDLRTVALNIFDLFKVLAGTVSSLRLLRRYKPEVVFSKGGFVVVPVGLAAYILRIPIITHDSDSVPGLANRIVGRFAKIHATALPQKYYHYAKDTIRYVGIPVDERVEPVTLAKQESYKNQINIDTKSRVLLVGGAGLGARDLNNNFVGIVPELLKQFSELFIIHITGQKHLQSVKAMYDSELKGQINKVRVLDFTPDFYKYSGAADVVITRAGATTIAELATQRKAVILVPASQLSGGHQLKNAQILKDNKAAIVVSNHDSKELLHEISNLLSSKNRREELAERISRFAKKDAAEELAKLIIECSEQRK